MPTLPWWIPPQIADIGKAAGEAATSLIKTPTIIPPTAPAIDKVTVERIGKLHPKLRNEAYNCYLQVVQALKGRAFCRFDLTLRTFKEQEALYAKGRTKPGKKVTNAKAGQSFHCYGLAIDYFLVVDTNGDGKADTAKWDIKTDYDGDGVADWIEVERIFAHAGWSWGGDWKSFKDYPHVQKTFGYHWSDLLAMHNAGHVDSKGYVLI